MSQNEEVEELARASNDNADGDFTRLDPMVAAHEAGVALVQEL